MNKEAFIMNAGNCSDVQWPPPIADSPSSTSGSPANAENAGDYLPFINQLDILSTVLFTRL